MRRGFETRTYGKVTLSGREKDATKEERPSRGPRLSAIVPKRPRITSGPPRPKPSPRVDVKSERTGTPAPSPSAFPFGNFVLRERMGVGGMAEIFVASPTEKTSPLPDLLAIKRLKGHVAATRDFLDMFVDEAKIVGRLDHPNIVRSFEYGQHDGAYYIAMELVRGMDLRRLLVQLTERGRTMPPILAAFIAEQMCLGLAHAHDLADESGEPIRLIHRDVTPHNVLVGFDGNVKLTDFGVAKTRIQTTCTQVGVVKGKVRYMSPEQARGKRIDHRSDIFSMGVCMYEMVTGRRLIDGEDQREMLDKVRAAKVDPLPSECATVPADLEEIILKALARDPGKRYRSARAVAEDLRAFLVSRRSSTVPLGEWMRFEFGSEHRDMLDRFEAFTRVSQPVVIHHNDDEPSVTRTDSSAAADMGEQTGSIVIPIFEGSVVTANPADPAPDSTGFTGSHPIQQTHTGSASFDGLTQVYFSVVEDLAKLRGAPEGSVVVGEGTMDTEIGGPQVPPPPAVPMSSIPPPRKLPSLGRITITNPSISGAEVHRIKRLALPLSLAALFAAAVGIGVAIALPADQGTLEVRLAAAEDVGDATVILDGVEQGVAPLRIEELSPGMHRIVVRAEGYEELVERVTMSPGGTIILAAALVPEPVAAAPPQSTSAAPTQAEQAADEALEEEARAEPRASPRAAAEAPRAEELETVSLSAMTVEITDAMRERWNRRWRERRAAAEATAESEETAGEAPETEPAPVAARPVRIGAPSTDAPTAQPDSASQPAPEPVQRRRPQPTPPTPPESTPAP